MEKTWKPTVAGIADIIVGCLSLTEAIGLFLIGVACDLIAGMFGGGPYFDALGSVSVISLPLLVLGILAVRGGIYALKRKRWRFALVGSVAAFLHFIMLLISGRLLTGFITVPIVFLITGLGFLVSVVFLFDLLLGIAAIIFTVLSKSEFE